MQGLWEDKFSSCKESVGNSLADHLLKGGSWAAVRACSCRDVRASLGL